MHELDIYCTIQKIEHVCDNDTAGTLTTGNLSFAAISMETINCYYSVVYTPPLRAISKETINCY